MDLTISMNVIMGVHSMVFSKSNRKWGAEYLYEKVRVEKEVVAIRTIYVMITVFVLLLIWY